MRPPKEIEMLLDDFFGGDATPEMIQAIDGWILESPEHARILAEYGLIDRLLVREQKKRNASVVFSLLHESKEATEEYPPYFSSEISRLTQDSKQGSEPGFKDLCLAVGYFTMKGLRAKAGTIGAIAAVLLIGLVLYIAYSGTDHAAQENPTLAGSFDGLTSNESVAQTRLAVATLTAEHESLWAMPGGVIAPHVGDTLHAGQRLTLTAGFAEITTNDGAIAILEAPATIELIDSNNALRLHSGKLVGLCHTESSKGFVVKTDYADITDLGTEFGVHAHRDGVETTVFVGEVVVKLPDAPSKLIKHSQTAHVSTDNGQPTLVVEEKPTASYARRLPRTPLITHASINLDGFAVQVVPNGVYEDAKLYTDRDHELNGIDANGLPAFLIGGDVIRMPADARPDKASTASDTLQLTLELSTPCDIYVLIPEKGKAGVWLERDYENTGLFAGSDMTGILDEQLGELKYALAVGPGSSIDERFEIWKRKQPAIGKTTVAENINGSMYSVIAVPAGPQKQSAQP